MSSVDIADTISQTIEALAESVHRLVHLHHAEEISIIRETHSTTVVLLALKAQFARASWLTAFHSAAAGMRESARCRRQEGSSRVKTRAKRKRKEPGMRTEEKKSPSKKSRRSGTPRQRATDRERRHEESEKGGTHNDSSCGGVAFFSRGACIVVILLYGNREQSAASLHLHLFQIQQNWLR